MVTRDLTGRDFGSWEAEGRPVVIAVIPAFNEERFIASVVINTLQYVERVIVVDDGSSDQTAMLARMAGADVVRCPVNGGKGQALNAGFARAQDLGPHAVVTLDGDAQHDPSEIPNLVYPILTGDADVVIGSRFLQTKSYIPRWRQFGQHTLTLVTNRASGTVMSDSQSGYRAFSVAALPSFYFETTGLAIESEMQFILQRSSLRVAEVPISVQYRDGNKRNPVLHGLAVMESIFSLVARRRPLAFFGLPGAVVMGLGLVVGGTVIHSVDTAHAVPIGTVVLSALCLLFGLTLSITGVILHSLDHVVGRIQTEMRTLSRGLPLGVLATGPLEITETPHRHPVGTQVVE